LLIIALVLLCDGPTLWGGYFESDDFVILNDVLHLPLPELLITTHNDHALVLLRLESWLMFSLFGASPLPYNAAILLSFSALLAAGAMLLRECEVSARGMLFFLLVCVGWTLWGPFTTGLYMIQKYMQIATF